jgi:DNA-binding CsgD family transcriptional regulator
MAARRTSLARGGLYELCTARLDSVTFRRKLRAELERLVRFDAYCVNTVDPLSLLITSSVGDGLSAAAARRLFELEESGGDFNPLATLVGAATLWQSTRGDAQRSPRMRELFWPLGLRDELRAALVVDRHCWGYLHLYRRQPFSVEDVERVQQLGPLLAQALRAACLVGENRAVALEPIVLRLGADAELLAEGAGDWRAAFAGDVGGETPHVLLTTVPRIRQGARVANGRYRSARGDWLYVSGSALGPDLALTLSAPRATQLAPLWCLATGLSARQRQICELMLEGHENETIATLLDVSLFTVKDHVKAILRKTGAASRVALVAALCV